MDRNTTVTDKTVTDKKYEIWPLKGSKHSAYDKCYPVFVDALYDGLTYDNTVDFKELAKYLIENKKYIDNILEEGICPCTSLLVSKSVLITSRENINHIFPYGRKDLFELKYRRPTFLEEINISQGGYNYQISDWLTDDVFERVNNEGKFSYSPDLIFYEGNSWYDREHMRKLLETKDKELSDLELLAGITNDKSVAEEFLESFKVDLTDMRKGGAGHDAYITSLIGLFKSNDLLYVTTFFADDDFRFIVKH